MAIRPHGEHYGFEPVGDRIWAGWARPTGTALSNCGLVDTGAGVLVFDTSLTLRAGREMVGAARSLTGVAPTMAANSHWHLDHLLGNQLFAGLPIYASRRTIEALRDHRAELERELTPGQLESDVRELAVNRARATAEAVRATLDGVLRVHRALLEESAERRLTSPTTGFEPRIDLPGGRGAHLVTFGSGHTESDTVLVLPDERIVFAGDLVVAETHPNLTSGDPEHWLQVLDEIERLHPERIVTGHGPLGSVATVAEVRDYLTTVMALADEPGRPEVPARFRSWRDADQFESNLAYVRTRRA